MLVWNLDKKNELTTNTFVDAVDNVKKSVIDLVNKKEALRVRLDSALQVVKGEVDDNNLGVDYFGVIFSDTPLSLKVQELCRVMRQIDEVQDIQFLRAETNTKKNTLSFYFNITSIYGELSYDKTFEL